MAKLIILSENDKALLKEMAAQYRSTRAGESRGRQQDRDVGWAGQAPECFVAITPPDGLPGLTEIGTGTGSGEEDQPGTAICPVYHISDTGELHHVVDHNKTVHNISTRSIGGSRFISVQRTKFGNWIYDPGDWQASWLEADIKELGSGSGTSVGILSSYSVDNVVYHDGYEPATPVEIVYNMTANNDPAGYAFNCIDNDHVYCRYSPAPVDKYFIWQKEC